MKELGLYEELLSAIQGSANLMRGMLLDPTIPDHAKEALRSKIKELEDIIDENT